MTVYVILISLLLLEIAVGDELSNQTISNSLPDIKESEPCIPGKSYKMDCNRCQCTSTKKLLCTKMACVDWKKYINNDNAKLRQREVEKEIKKAADKVTKKPKADSNLPPLPEGLCKPGKVYSKECRRCFCDDKGQASCSMKKDACTIIDGLPKHIRHPEDLRPPFTREELKALQELDSESQMCVAGKTYIVSCNTCLCTELNNLICTKELCLSFDDINRVEAYERSGKKCTDDNLPPFTCVKCECIKGKTECKEIEGCDAETRRRLARDTKHPLKMKIDPIKDKCVPNAIYTENCNRCYCQPDGSLRCTQKTCLNYSQSKLLEEQFNKLRNEAK